MSDPASAGGAPVVVSTLADENVEGTSFGDDATATIGQTVTVPEVTSPSGDGIVLTKFSLRLNVPEDLVFRGFVYAWDGTKASGPELFRSASTHTSGSASMETVTFTTPGVPVVAGQEYVIFASISVDAAFDVGKGNGPYGLVAPGTYSDGTFVYLNNGDDTSQWTGSDWNQLIFVVADAAFSATFAPTPPTPPTPPSTPAPTPVRLVANFTG